VLQYFAWPKIATAAAAHLSMLAKTQISKVSLQPKPSINPAQQARLHRT
jgi:hypothetical protein